MQVLKLVAALPFVAVVWALPSYQIVGLGNLGGPATAYGINNSGMVVGTSATPFGGYVGFSWNGGSMVALEGLPYSMQQYAAGVNAQGTVVGSAAGPDGYVPVQWQNGVVQQIGADVGNAMAVNDSGAVAGSANGQAFRTVNGQVQSLGTLMGGNWASAYGINASGDVAGYGNTASGAMRGFVSVNGVLQAIGTLGGGSSYAMGLNNAGQVVGHAENGAGYNQAVLYQGGSLTSLGTLGGSASYAYGINQAGMVVGYSWTSGDLATAGYLYWNGQMSNLNDLVGAGSGWDIQAVYGINDLGQIVGTGVYNGEQMAVLLNPTVPVAPVFSAAAVGSAVPEPGTVAMLGAGLGLMALGAWRRSRG